MALYNRYIHNGAAYTRVLEEDAPPLRPPEPRPSPSPPSDPPLSGAPEEPEVPTAVSYTHLTLPTSDTV